MAPILKTSLAICILAFSATLLDTASAKKHSLNYGRHAKLARRGTLFEDLGKRSSDDFAPFGLDRCGLPRKKPYVHKASASPVPSSKYKKCPKGSPGYKKEHKHQSSSTSEPATATANNVVDNDDDADDDADADDASSDSSNTYTLDHSTSATPNTIAVNDATFTSNPAWTSSPSSSSYPVSSTSKTWKSTPESSTSTYYPPASASSSSSSSEYIPASSSSQVDSSTPAVKVKAEYAAGKPASSSSSTWSSTSTWVAPAYTPAPSSSSVAPAYTPAPSSNSGGGGGGMLGLGWDYRNPTGVLSKWTGANYIYTWSAYPPSDALPGGMEWLPHYWGPGKQGDFDSQVASGAIKPGMTILGYNEPDQPGQSNLAVSDGISSYKSQITPYASQGYTLATPACVNDDTGFDWISGFVQGCSGQCGFSLIQTHYYGTDANAFIAYITKLHDAFNMDIIISEWAPETFGNGPDLDMAATQAYLSTTQAWLNSQSFIHSYFWFGPVTSGALGGVNPNNQLIDDGGNINSLGWQYKNSA